jgi:hypothetical protein
MRHGNEEVPGRTRLDICLACGGPMEEPLKRLGSLRCMDCRDGQRPLDPALADDARLRSGLSRPAGLVARLRGAGSTGE